MNIMQGSLDPPLVSIVVPVFNGERFLRESLDSILAQTYPRVEVLVMDDASTDSTPEIIASYGDRVVACRQQINRGIYANANDGIARARGEFIAVYHADDVYDRSIVEREVEFLLRYPCAGAAFCQDIFIDTEGREFGRLELPPELRRGRPLRFPVILNALLTYKNRFLRCPGGMVRASVYREVGTYRSDEFHNNADLEMWLRISRRYPLGILEEHLFRYRWGHENSSRRHRRLRTDQERFFAIMDACLDEGGRASATPEALVAYEAHRAEDRLMRSVNHYILGELSQARSVLAEVRCAQLVRTDRVQRGRLLALYLGLSLLLRLPRIRTAADLFRSRWQAH
jgi:glycosyltransferase involved in cell wall biosynthesis